MFSCMRAVILGQDSAHEQLGRIQRGAGGQDPTWKKSQMAVCFLKNDCTDSTRSLNVELVYEKKNKSLVFGGSRKIPTLGSTVQWETRQASFPTGTVGPWVGIFLSLPNTNDGFYLSHIPVPAHGKDEKRTAVRRPHVDP